MINRYLKRFQIKLFADKGSPPTEIIEVPLGAEFLTVTALPEGIYGWYLVPDNGSKATRREEFLILNMNQPVPENAVFVTVIDLVYNMEEGSDKQGLVIFPIFKLNYTPETVASNLIIT